MKIKQIYIVSKNYGQHTASFDNENIMLTYVMTENRNNLTKTLNQQVIKGQLKKFGQFTASVGKLNLKIEVVNMNNASNAD